MLNEKDLSAFQARLSFWPHLTAAQRKVLLSGTQPLRFASGQSVFCKEAECLGVLLLRKGCLRVYITSEEGREVTLYRLEPGDICILSASCILENIYFDVFIEAETDCELFQINAAAFAHLSAENLHVELFSYKLATDRFSEVMWVFQQILFTSFDKRLAAFLLDEAAKNPAGEVRMTHEQIAKYLGTAREVVSRMLKYFSDEGLVTRSRGGITLTDKAQLFALVKR